jgi:hypothetical protein
VVQVLEQRQLRSRLLAHILVIREAKRKGLWPSGITGGEDDINSANGGRLNAVDLSRVREGKLYLKRGAVFEEGSCI